jgi:hypothetical protein
MRRSQDIAWVAALIWLWLAIGVSLRQTPFSHIVAQRWA